MIGLEQGTTGDQDSWVVGERSQAQVGQVEQLGAFIHLRVGLLMRPFNGKAHRDLQENCKVVTQSTAFPRRSTGMTQERDDDDVITPGPLVSPVGMHL